MTDLSQRVYGSEAKPLSRLTDEELQLEARRRRARRAARTTAPANGEDRQSAPEHRAAPDTGSPAAAPKQVRQWYANLELPEGAGSDEVERAYGQLVRRYDPDRHKDDPDRHRAALALTRSLTRAYRGLMAYLREPTPQS